MIDEVVEAPVDQHQYRELLRPIGALLDQMQAHYVTLAEIDAAFIWHCFPKGDLSNAAYGTVLHSEIPRLREQIKQSRRRKLGLLGLTRTRPKAFSPASRRTTICPEGYEEMFRSLSVRLDRERAHSITLIERDESLIVHYAMIVPLFMRSDASRISFTSSYHEDIYSREQIAQMISTAVGNRGTRYYR